MRGMTQKEKIVALMIRRRAVQEWFYPYEFMPPRLPFSDPLCVGYKAPTRIAELHDEFPDLFEKKDNVDGKYTIRRFRFENLSVLLSTMPAKWVKFIREELDRHGVSYKVFRQVPIRTANGVRFERREVEGNKKLSIDD